MDNKIKNIDDQGLVEQLFVRALFYLLETNTGVLIENDGDKFVVCKILEGDQLSMRLKIADFESDLSVGTIVHYHDSLETAIEASKQSGHELLIPQSTSIH